MSSADVNEPQNEKKEIAQDMGELTLVSLGNTPSETDTSIMTWKENSDKWPQIKINAIHGISLSQANIQNGSLGICMTEVFCYF